MKYARLLKTTNFLELVKFFRAELLSKKILASLRLWDILSVLPDLRKDLWIDLEEFIVYLATNRQDKILPVGYTLTGVEGTKRAFITGCNEDILLWKKYGNVKVNTELDLYALYDTGKEVHDLIAKYDADVISYIKEDYLTILLSDLPDTRNTDSMMDSPFLLDDSILMDSTADAHKLWSYVHLIAAVTNGGADKIDLKKTRNIDIILLLLYSSSLDNLSLNFIFNFVNFAYYLTEYILTHSKQNIQLLNMVWYRISLIFWHLPEILDCYYGEDITQLLYQYKLHSYFNYFKLMAVYFFNNFIKDDERITYVLHHTRLKEYVANLASRDRQVVKYVMFYQELAKRAEFTNYHYVREHASSGSSSKYIVVEFYSIFNNMLFKATACPLIDILASVCKKTSTFSLYKTENEALSKEVYELKIINRDLITAGERISSQLDVIKRSYDLSCAASKELEEKVVVLDVKVLAFVQIQQKMQCKVELAIEQLNLLLDSNVDNIQLVSLSEVSSELMDKALDKFFEVIRKLQNKTTTVHTIVSSYSLYHDSYHELYVFKYVGVIYKMYHLVLENFLLFINRIEAKPDLNFSESLKLLPKKIFLTKLINVELAYDSYKDNFNKIPDREVFQDEHKKSYSHEELAELLTRLNRIALLVKMQFSGSQILPLSVLLRSIYKIESSITEFISVIDLQFAEQPICQLDDAVLPRKVPVL